MDVGGVRRLAGLVRAAGGSVDGPETGGGKMTKMARHTPPLSADRVRTGWQGPAGTRFHVLARGQDVEAANALTATTGDGVRIIPVLQAAIEDGSAACAMLAGLGGGSKTYHDAAPPTPSPTGP